MMEASVLLRSRRIAAIALALLGASVFAPASAFAQSGTGTVRGKVTDASSTAPVPGAQVFIVGTRLGGVTGGDGTYSFSGVPAGAQTVRVRAIGFKPAEKNNVSVVGGASVQVDFAVATAAVSLDEVVVTGTAGSARKREVGNSIGQLQLAEAPTAGASISSMLTASLPGVSVAGGTGNSGSGTAIRLRGTTSVALTNQPLIYVDGVRTRSDEYPRNGIFTGTTQRGANAYASPLSDINPEDIERIEVVKGAAAATLYGTDAAAGVIQIFTKRGSQGAAKWTMQINSGISKLQKFGTDEAPLLFMDPFVRHAQRYGVSAQVAGGTQNNVRYLISAGADNTEGVLANDLDKKYNLRVNLDFSPARNLTIGWNSSYTNDLIDQTPAGNNAQGVTLNAFRRDRNYFASQNPDTIRQVYQQQLHQIINRSILGTTVTWTPILKLSSKLTIGYDNAAIENRNLRPYGFPAVPLGVIQNQRWSSSTISTDWVNSYEFNPITDLRMTASAGTQYVSSSVSDVVGLSENFPAPTEATVASGSLKNADENRATVVTGGLFGQALIGYKDKYFVTVGARIDGNSAFGKDFGFQTYPKISASWVVSDEGFWKQSLGTLKFRAARGEAGRAPGAFASVQTWNPVGWGGQPAVRPLNLGNADLGPERTSETELGFDHSIFDGRLSTDFTWYKATTTDALFNVRNIPSNGFLNSSLKNAGKMEKSGVELAITGLIWDRPLLGITAGLNISTNQSKVLDLGGAPAFSVGNNGWVVVGKAAPVVRGRLIRNPDAVGGVPDTVSNYDFGPSQPTKIIGGSISVRTWKNITASLRGEYQGGAFINEDASYQALTRSVLWPTCFDAYPKLAANQPVTVRERLTCVPANIRSDMFIFPADFFKLRDLTIDIPLGRLIPRTGSSSLVLSAKNFYRRNYGMPLFDPEMSGNDGFNATVRYISEHIPAPATFSSSIRISF
jgi:TonB-dependent SusC/RagA subfamily outer membrane receptor